MNTPWKITAILATLLSVLALLGIITRATGWGYVSAEPHKVSVYEVIWFFIYVGIAVYAFRKSQPAPKK